MPVFEKSCLLPGLRVDAFAYLANPLTFFRLTPPWEPVTLLKKTGGIGEGDQMLMAIQPVPGLVLHWLAEHQRYIEHQQFQDVQKKGPFAQWVHTHLLTDVPAGQSGPEACQLTDHIVYRLPFDWVTGPLGYWVVARKLVRMFAYRHAIMQLDLSLPFWQIPLQTRQMQRVWVSAQVPFKADIDRLLGLLRVTVCRYLDEAPTVTLAPSYEASTLRLKSGQSNLWDLPPDLPAAFAAQLDAHRADFSVAYNQVLSTYRYVFWVLSDL
jgi:ligand-binding SRPBCC domain-containing protein